MSAKKTIIGFFIVMLFIGVVGLLVWTFQSHLFSTSESFELNPVIQQTVPQNQEIVHAVTDGELPPIMTDTTQPCMPSGVFASMAAAVPMKFKYVDSPYLPSTVYATPET